MSINSPVKRLIYSLVALLAFPAVCAAQSGGLIVRVEDGASSRCINDKTDEIWVILRRVITNRQASWLKQDSSVATFIKATVVTAQNSQTVSFPLMDEETVEGLPKGQVSIPEEYVIVNEFKLDQGNTRYSALNLDLTLVNRQTQSAWGTALNALAQIAGSQKIPLPSSPFTQAGSYLLNFANSALQKDIDAQNAKKDAIKSAQIALAFDPDGQCQGDGFEKTGTFAVVQSQGITGDGYVNLRDVDNYCWKADLTPTFALKAAPKDPAKSCTDSQYRPHWKTVTNNYVGFVLNAEPASSVLGPQSADYQNAISRCQANGLTAEQCFPKQ
jgi:hypothetical protein